MVKNIVTILSKEKLVIFIALTKVNILNKGINTIVRNFRQRKF